MKSVKRYFL